ncbi:MAG TPA: tRNA epoxyqueuosine(34) reductase QueG [Polyangiaceae bacterium]
MRRHEPARAARESPSSDEIATRIRAAALELGFVEAGFTSLGPYREAREALMRWVEAEYAGTMDYLRNPERADPKRLFPDALTLVSLALPYPGSGIAALRKKGERLGLVARYARGDDYHHVLRNKLWKLADACAEFVGRPVVSRACVDSAPLLEHEAARRAGIGFTGKSTLTIVPGAGTFVFLGELLLDVDIAPSLPIGRGCGSCTLCLEACPTRAFVGPYVLDARRCIAYLTIENRGQVPRELRAAIGNRMFGCDVCQDVCPYNATAQAPAPPPELEARPGLDAADAVEWLALGAAQYRKLTKRSALGRATREQLARNAAVVLGNLAEPASLAPLEQAALGHSSAIVRGHAAWALGRLAAKSPGTVDVPRVTATLERLTEDTSPFVRDEARAALGSLCCSDDLSG